MPKDLILAHGILLINKPLNVPVEDASRPSQFLSQISHKAHSVCFRPYDTKQAKMRFVRLENTVLYNPLYSRGSHFGDFRDDVINVKLNPRETFA